MNRLMWLSPCIKNLRLVAPALGASIVITGALFAPTVSARGVVGQILLVAGECPAGFLPADGRTITANEYPELAAVLNEPTEVRFAQIDPVFAGDITPTPNPDPDSGSELRSPIEQVLYKTVDGTGKETNYTFRLVYGPEWVRTNSAEPADHLDGVTKFISLLDLKDYQGISASDYVIKTLAVNDIKSSVHAPDGTEIPLSSL